MRHRLEKLYSLIQTYPRRALAFAGLAIVLLALPLTLSVSQQQQNIVQHAAVSDCHPEAGGGGTNAHCGGVATGPMCNGTNCATQGYYCSAGSCVIGWAGGSASSACSPACGTTAPGHSASNTTTATARPTPAPIITPAPIPAANTTCNLGRCTGTSQTCHVDANQKPGYWSCVNGCWAAASCGTGNHCAATKNASGATVTGSVSCYPDVAPGTTTTTTTTTTTATQPTAPTPIPNAAAKNGQGCGTATSPALKAVANGQFTYCSGGTLHVGNCSGGNIPQLGGTGSGVVCKAPAIIAGPLNRLPADRLPSEEGNQATDDAASATQVTGACGVQIPANYWSDIQAQAQRDYPDKNFTSGTVDSLSAAQWTAEAQKAGYSTAVIAQSGTLGDPYSAQLVNQPGNPSNPGDVFGSYVGCVGVMDDFGTASNMQAYCYRNGQQVGSPIDITGNTDMVALQNQVLGCTRGGSVSGPVQGPSAPANTNTGTNTTLNLSTLLSGVNTSDSSTTKTTSKNFLVQLLNPQNQVVDSKNVNLNLNPKTKQFQGSVDFNSIAQTTGYKVSLTTPGYFQESTQTVIPIASDQKNNIEIPTLQAGDITGTGTTTPNVLDYNVLISCSIFSKDAGSACKDNSGGSLKTASDLNADGQVNQDDYTILLRSWKQLSL